MVVTKPEGIKIMRADTLHKLTINNDPGPEAWSAEEKPGEEVRQRPGPANAPGKADTKKGCCRVSSLPN